MNHVDTLSKFGNVEDPVFEPSVDTNLLNTWSHGRHRFAVVWFKPLLDTPQLEPRDASCVGRKSFEIVPRRSEPKQRLVRHTSISKF
jgi:hypothetical protein